MITKHFFKTLIAFMFMILIGLLGLFLISYFGEAERGGGGGASAIKGYEYFEVAD